MYVEIHKLAGSGNTAPVYPEISEEDWQAWQAFLPVRTSGFRERAIREFKNPAFALNLLYDIPHEAGAAIYEAAGHFDWVEVWGKKNLRKDPIAVGIRLIDGTTHRYLITRWGPDALLPFETIKRRQWLYRIINRRHYFGFFCALAFSAVWKHVFGF